MALVKVKCPVCNYEHQTDSVQDAANCPSCGKAYIVAKAIQLYNTSHSGNNSGLSADSAADFVIRAGELLEYKGASTHPVIPGNVTMIGEKAFYNCHGLVGVTIPDSVTSIGKDAFFGCNGLRSITIPDSVTLIDDQAFVKCVGLTSVTIPDSVTQLGRSVLSDCKGLKKVTLPRGFTEIPHALVAATGLETFTIPDGVTRIGGSAFLHCRQLRSLHIPDSVTQIDDWAFKGCDSLMSLTIPDSVTTIGERAFGDGPTDFNLNLQINASEEWKQRHWRLHPNLHSYAPPPPKKKKSGCYIATAVYGSYDCPSVWVLRRYRDERLSATFWGRLFIRFYYMVSPTMVRLFGRQEMFNRFWKKHLDSMVGRLKSEGYADTPYQDNET